VLTVACVFACRCEHTCVCKSVYECVCVHLLCMHLCMYACMIVLMRMRVWLCVSGWVGG